MVTPNANYTGETGSKVSEVSEVYLGCSFLCRSFLRRQIKPRPEPEEHGNDEANEKRKSKERRTPNGQDRTILHRALGRGGCQIADPIWSFRHPHICLLYRIASCTSHGTLFVLIR